jgi:hypothetical protein
VTDVAVVVPVLGRPERVAPLAESLADSVRDVGCALYFVASSADYPELDALNEWARPLGASYFVSSWPPGPADWARKINLAYRLTGEPWVFTGADDLCFCPGWADAAIECATATGAGVVGTQDYGNSRVIAGDHATHNLVARWYADELGTVDGPGAVVTEAYSHNFVDNELVETAKARQLWTFCAESEVPHLHPNWDRSVRRDETYALGERDFNEDARLFRQRLPVIRRS